MILILTNALSVLVCCIANAHLKADRKAARREATHGVQALAWFCDCEQETTRLKPELHAPYDPTLKLEI
jgi:hypothetical protein